MEARALPWSEQPDRQTLSPRELEVLDLASHGMTNAEIARRLRLSVHAVKFHLASVYRKLRVANRTEAAFAYLLAQQRNESPTGQI